MADAISRAWTSKSLKSVWNHIRPHIPGLLGSLTTPPLRHAIPLIFPVIIWDAGLHMVDLLLQIAYHDSLRRHIPLGAWAWLKERPLLPRICRGRCFGTTGAIVQHIRGLEDIEILKSYFFVVWSEWDFIYPDGIEEMEISIREDFGGIGMEQHRKDLVERLDHVVCRLRVPGQKREKQYKKLKEVLLEVGGQQ